MKKYILISLTFLLFSCNSHKSKIINDWNLVSITTFIDGERNENTMSESRTTLDMKNDGSFTFKSAGDDNLINHFFPFYNTKGFWKLKGDILSLQFTDGNDDGITLDFRIIEEASIDRFRMEAIRYTISTGGVSINDIKEISTAQMYFVSFSFDQAF